MPIYEFRCNKCDMTFEELCFNQKDTEKVTCPECNNKQVERLMSAFGFVSGKSSTSTNSSSSSACNSCRETSCSSCKI